MTPLLREDPIIYLGEHMIPPQDLPVHLEENIDNRQENQDHPGTTAASRQGSRSRGMYPAIDTLVRHHLGVTGNVIHPGQDGPQTTAHWIIIQP